MAGGRPSIYTKELGDTICEQIALGSNFNRLSKLEEYPSTDTLFRWRREIPEFSENYQKAIIERAHARYDSIDEILDMLLEGGIEPSAAKVIVSAKQWQCSKEDQKNYGDKKAVEHSGSVTVMGSVLVDDEEVDLGLG